MRHRNRLASTAECIGAQADLLIAPHLFSTSFPVWFSSMNLVWLNCCAGRFCRYFMICSPIFALIYHYVKYDPVSSGQLSMAPCTGKINSLVWKSNGCSIYRNPQPQKCTLYLFTYYKKAKDNAETCTGSFPRIASHTVAYKHQLSKRHLQQPDTSSRWFYSAIFCCSDFKFAPGTLFSRCLRFGALPCGSCRQFPACISYDLLSVELDRLQEVWKWVSFSFFIVLNDAYLLNLLGVGYVWSQENHK